MGSLFLGSPVVPFYFFFGGVPLLKPNSRKKGTLIIKGLLGNLVFGLLYGLDKGLCVTIGIVAIFVSLLVPRSHDPLSWV